MSLTQELGIQTAGDGFKSLVALDVEASLASDIELKAAVPREQLHFVLSVLCRLGISKNLFKVLIWHKQRRDPSSTRKQKNELYPSSCLKSTSRIPKKAPPACTLE